MEIDEVAARVREALSGLPPTAVLAVWSDGSLTEHGFAFWGERLPDGSRRVPLATFVRGVSLPSPVEIVAKFKRGLELRGPVARLAGRAAAHAGAIVWETAQETVVERVPKGARTAR